MKRVAWIFLALSFSLLYGLPVVADAAPPRACFHAHAKFEKSVGYCQAVRHGDTLYISGTAAGGEMPDAVRSVYDQLQKTLKARGLTFADVITEHVYTTDLDAFKQHENLRKTYYGKVLPAATWTQVQRLFTPNLVLEVELVAKYPD